MVATVFNEAVHPCAPIVSEAPSFQSRDNILIEASTTIVVGQVLGKAGVVASETVTVTAKAGNVGTGVVTPDATNPIRGDALDGQYQVEFLSTGATAEFNVIDPKGELVGDGAVGTGFVGPIKFAIADNSGAHYTLGDILYFQVARPVGDDQWAPLNLTASDGTQVAAAIALYPIVTPSSGDPNRISAITRNAEMRAADLTWPSGATAAQIAEATNQLLQKGIILR